MEQQISQQIKDQLLIDIFKAYYKARKNKRYKLAQFKFEMNYEKHLIQLHKEISTFKYKPKTSIAFINRYPVIREVFAARFPDRVINHLIFNYINPLFEENFIEDSYSCRKNKGTLYGIEQAKKYLQECTENYTKQGYILKLDIKGYFYSLDKNILYSQISKFLFEKKDKLKIDYKVIDFLIKQTIFTNHSKNAYKIKDDPLWKILPQDKSLYYAKEGTGLPIGNLTSQLFSNIYLNAFDHFVKNELEIKYYGRYVDDFYLFHTDKDYLLSTIKTIRKYLKDELNLNLHPKKIYFQPHQRGMEFLGAYIKPNNTMIAKRTKTKLYSYIFLINKTFNSEAKTKEFLFSIRAKINSYLGLLSKFNTFKLRTKIMSRITPLFFEYFYLNNSNSKIIIYRRYL